MNGLDRENAVVADWLDRAAEDLRVAEMLAPHGLCNTVAYHCQQAAEKLLKGLLIGLGTAPRKTHELDLLLQAARTAGQLANIDLDDAAFGLTPFATVSRYPGWGHVSQQQAEQAIVWARLFDRVVRAAMAEIQPVR